jgi:hypothetical protein
MKKEIIIATAGTTLLLIVFAFKFDDLKTSSPLALILIASVGLLASARFKLVGGTLLTFSGIALIVHPFLFSSSFWLLPGSLLISIAGIILLINWWRQNGN